MVTAQTVVRVEAAYERTYDRDWPSVALLSSRVGAFLGASAYRTHR
jgi:hypothetical protein